MCRCVGSARFEQCDAHTIAGVFPRTVAVLAALVAFFALIVLGSAYSNVWGTTAAVNPIFEANCLAVAKYAGIVAAAAVGVGFITDLFYAADKSIREKNFKLLPPTFLIEAAITLGTPIFFPSICLSGGRR